MKNNTKTLSVADLKAQFSSVVQDLRQGKEIQITYGRNHTPLATIVPQSKLEKPNYSIKLGDLQAKKGTFKMENFEMTTEELLGL